MWWSMLRWHHHCLEMQIEKVIFPRRWLPPVLSPTKPYSHSTCLLNQEEPHSPISSPQFALQHLPFPSLHLLTHTHAHFEPIQHIQATAVWLFMWQWGWIKLARLPQHDGSVSRWWLRSLAAFLPRAGNSNSIRAKTPPCTISQWAPWGWGQNRNRMKVTKVKV